MKSIYLKEKWKEVAKFKDYEVSDHGRIRRKTEGPRTYPGRVLKPWEQSWGYLQVTLNGKHIRVHKLVLNAFGVGKMEGFQANHKDGNKKNNHIKNLEWLSPKDNMIHSYRTGLHSKITGEKHPMSKLSKNDVINIRYRLKNKKHGDITKIANEYCVHKSTISKIALGKGWL